MVEPAFFGPVDAVLARHLGPGLVIEYLLFVLVLANLATRMIAHRTHVEQAAEGDDAVKRHPLHQATNLLLVVGSFYYLTLHHHAGIVLTTLVLGLFLVDFFEFEARKVEARNDLGIDKPKGAIVTSMLVLAYAFYISLFFVIKPVWSAIV